MTLFNKLLYCVPICRIKLEMENDNCQQIN